MAALKISYDDRQYSLDLEDMDMDQARAMERYGVPNLKSLEEGIAEGDLRSLAVAYWLMLQQNGDTATGLDQVTFKPLKFVRSVFEAVAAATAEAEDDAPKED